MLRLISSGKDRQTERFPISRQHNCRVSILSRPKRREVNNSGTLPEPFRQNGVEKEPECKVAVLALKQMG